MNQWYITFLDSASISEQSSFVITCKQNRQCTIVNNCWSGWMFKAISTENDCKSFINEKNTDQAEFLSKYTYTATEQEHT